MKETDALTNFPKLIRALLNDETNWATARTALADIDPEYADVEFPPHASAAFLIHPSRVGKNMVWVEEVRGDPHELQRGGSTSLKGRYDVHCYVRAKSSQNSDIENAEDLAENMRAICSKIVKTNTLAVTGAFEARPIGTYPLTERNLVPMYFIRVLSVQVIFEA